MPLLLLAAALVAAGAVAFVLLSQKEEMISTLQPDAEGNEQDTSQTKGKTPSTPEEDPRGRDLPPKDSPPPPGERNKPPAPGNATAWKFRLDFSQGATLPDPGQSCYLLVFARYPDGTRRLIAKREASLGGLQGEPLVIDPAKVKGAEDLLVEVKSEEGPRRSGIISLGGGTGDLPDSFDLQLTAIPELHGQVITEKGKPAGEAMVILFRPQAGGGGRITMPSEWAKEFRASGEGEFFLREIGLPPYVLFANHLHLGLSEMMRIETVGDVPKEMFRLIVKPAVFLHGTIREQDGTPAEGLTLYIEGTSSGLRLRTQTRDDGTFAVHASPQTYNIWPQWPRRATLNWQLNADEDSPPLHLPGRSNVTLSIREKATGKPMTAYTARVEALIDNGVRWRVDGRDKMGNTTFEAETFALLPGTYILSVLADGYRPFISPPLALPGSSDPVTLTASMERTGE
jgi:hypothetical protein